MTFIKADAGKLEMGLLPPKALEGVAAVLTFGRKKYAAWNWIKAPTYSRYYDAAQRHLAAWHAGDLNDSDSGLSHLYHALCCLIFLSEMQRLGVGLDDRPTDDVLRAQAAVTASGQAPK